MKRYNKIYKCSYSFSELHPMSMSLAYFDSLVLQKTQSVCLLLLVMSKTYFFWILLDHLSKLHQISYRSSSEHAGKKTFDISRHFHIMHCQSWHECPTVFYALSWKHYCLLHWNLICKITSMLWWLLIAPYFAFVVVGPVIAACRFILFYI